MEVQEMVDLGQFQGNWDKITVIRFYENKPHKKVFVNSPYISITEEFEKFKINDNSDGISFLLKDVLSINSNIDTGTISITFKNGEHCTITVENKRN